MNWQPIATIAAPILAFFVGVFVNRRLERSPKVVSFMSNATAVQVHPPNGQPFMVHTHSVVVRNAGRGAANNIRLSHALLPPDFSVYPSVDYTVSQLPSGGTDIVFPNLVPGEQVSVTYLYYPPTLFSHVNTHVKSDEGFAKIVTILWEPQPPKWLRRVSVTLMAFGAGAVIYALMRLGWSVWPMLVGP